MNVDVIIMTTAVDRPKLHQEVFPKYLKYIGDMNYEWIITINQIFDSLDESVNYFKSIIPPERVHIKTFDSGGTLKHHWDSSKYAMNLANELRSPKSVFFYLEDDWMPKSDKYNLQNDMAELKGDKSYVGLVKREVDAISFNPSLWGNQSFSLMFDSINNPENSYEYAKMRDKFYIENGELYSNPERVCCPRDNKYSKQHHVSSLKLIDRFKDVGRAWQDKNIKRRTWDLKK